METSIKALDIQRRIYAIRGLQVMLDSDLAVLYGVETKVLNQAVKRNLERFPDLFCFQLTQSEFDSLRSQIVTLETEPLRSQIATSKSTSGGRRYLPFVFTEQGVAMPYRRYRSDPSGKTKLSSSTTWMFIILAHLSKILVKNGVPFLNSTKKLSSY